MNGRTCRTPGDSSWQAPWQGVVHCKAQLVILLSDGPRTGESARGGRLPESRRGPSWAPQDLAPQASPPPRQLCGDFFCSILVDLRSSGFSPDFGSLVVNFGPQDGQKRIWDEKLPPGKPVFLLGRPNTWTTTESHPLVWLHRALAFAIFTFISLSPLSCTSHNPRHRSHPSHIILDHPSSSTSPIASHIIHSPVSHDGDIAK